MLRSNGFAINFSISDCGARFNVSDYSTAMLDGCAELIAVPGSLSDTAGLLAANLRASLFPDLVTGTGLGLLFPLYIHLTDIQSGPVYPWQQNLATSTEVQLPYHPYPTSPYPLTSPPTLPLERELQGPWQQSPLDRYPCPRPLAVAGGPEIEGFEWPTEVLEGLNGRPSIDRL